MDNQEIIVSIDSEGNVSVKVEGVSGPSCTGLTKTLERKLGATTQQTKTKEYREVENEGQRHRNWA